MNKELETFINQITTFVESDTAELIPSLPGRGLKPNPLRIEEILESGGQVVITLKPYSVQIDLTLSYKDQL